MGESNLLRAIWEQHASRAALWRALCLGSWALTALALLLCLRLLNRPREVIRIGCDGIPQLVRLDTEQYTEPNEREMQAFVRLWTVAYARNDSFSAVNDAVHAGHYMVPELREVYRRRMRGTAEQAGLLAQLEALGEHRARVLVEAAMRVRLENTDRQQRLHSRGCVMAVVVVLMVVCERHSSVIRVAARGCVGMAMLARAAVVGDTSGASKRGQRDGAPDVCRTRFETWPEPCTGRVAHTVQSAA